MSGDPGPWDRRDPPPPQRRQGRLGLWLLIAAGLGAVVLTLARAFPDANLTGEDWAYVGYAAALLLVVSAGVMRLRREMLGQHLRHVAIWVGIVAGLALVAAYRHDLADVPGRLQMAFGGGTPVVMGGQELMIGRDASGAYVVVGAVNGQRVRFIVDTGATETVLSPQDAQRVGAPMAALRYTDAAQTANGVGYSAAYVADRLEVGSIRFDAFEMAVNQAPMSHSLLGMTFLNRLESFEVRSGKLILKARGTGGGR